MRGDPRNLDTYADGWDDSAGFTFAGTCDGCGLMVRPVVGEDLSEDESGLMRVGTDSRFLCRACCEAEADGIDVEAV